MYITREKFVRAGLMSVILIICVAIVGVVLSGINHFKLGSQLAGVNQVTNLSHLLVRQQANLFSLMLVKNVKNEELVEALDNFAKEEFVIDANLYSASGTLIAQSSNALSVKSLLQQQNQQTHSATQQIVEPILAQQDLVGFLRVTFNAEYGQTTQNKVNELFNSLYGQLIILFLAGGLFVSCFYGFLPKHPLTVNFPLKFSTESPKTQAQRFHSRRRAFRRK